QCVFHRAPAAEVLVAPDRGEPDDRRQLLDQSAGGAVPAEAVEGPSRDVVNAVHEPAHVLEGPLHAEQLEVVAVGAAGAVAEGDGPQLPRAAAARVPRPGPRELYL